MHPRHVLRRAVRLGGALALLAALGAGAQAHDYTAGALKIGHPWSRATPGGAKVAGGYLSVTNTGTEPDRLTGASFARAGRAELHSMSMEGGVMKMAPVAGGLAIKPGETLRLEPGGYHLMFLDLQSPLAKGDKVEGTLTFEKAGSVPVSFVVEAIGARSSGGDKAADGKGETKGDAKGEAKPAHDHGHSH